MVYRLFYAQAMLGGLMLVLLALLSGVSITGRALSPWGLGPVPGDFELVEAGTALAVFCFLPWCHLERGHATVDLFFKSMGAAAQRAVLVVSDLAMALVWLLLSWRLVLATGDFYDNGEVTFILQMPLWLATGASAVAATLGCVGYLWKLLETLSLVQAPPPLANGHNKGH